MSEIYDDEVLFENLDYGCYMIVHDGIKSFDENVKYATADFSKLYVNRVRLPDGRGNIVYVLSNNFDNSINLIANRSFVTPPSYKKIFYPSVTVGKFLNKRYRVNVLKEANERRQTITSKTKLKPYPTRYLSSNMSENIFFITSDLYNVIKPYMEKFTIKKNYENFFPSFVSILKGMSPAPNEKFDKQIAGSNARVMVIDCSSFGFRNGAPLGENKTNPLFLLYLAYLRTKDLSKMNVDMDMLICYNNMFMKFNPKKMNKTKLDTFKRALFRIMNANMDNYVDQLSDDEKKEVEDTAKDKTLAAIVNDVTSPYTKYASASVEETLKDAIKTSYTKQVTDIAAMDKVIKDTQKATAQNIGVKAPEQPKKDIFQQVMDKPASLLHTNPVRSPFDKKKEDLFSSVIGQYQPLVRQDKIEMDDPDYDPDDFDEEENPDTSNIGTFDDDEEEVIKDDVTEILTSDEEVLAEVLDEVQDKVAPMNNPKTAPVNSARDQKLREEQKKIVVKNSTIEEIIARDAKNVPIKSSNKSAVMHTTNQNMHNMTFNNFDKTYLDELYVKDLVSCFDMLKDKDSPFYITAIDVHDSSDSLNLKETWTVHLVDENKKRHTIKVDIPKFQNDRFLWFEGNKWIILKQNMYNPLVKDTPDTVIISTNYNKVTVKRKSTKSTSTIERIFSLIKKTGDTKVFITGDSSRGNVKYISSLEYDEISRRLFKFHSKSCTLYFSRDYINDHLMDNIPGGIEQMKKNEFFIGTENKAPIFISERTGLDRMGRTIAEIIEQNLSDDYRALYNSIKPPTQSMYVEGKLAGEFIPAIVTLVVWEGLTKTLERMGIKWRFDNTIKRLPAPTSGKKYIRFADGILEYEAETFAELLLNGLAKLHPEKLTFADFDTEICYDDYVYAQWGTYNGITELRNFYEFLIDPITKDVCRDLMLPDDPSGLLIHAVKLLSDNAYVSKASDKSYRVRSIEMIPGILYECIARQYKAYVRSGRRLPMTLKQSCVIDRLKAEKTVETYSTLNPAIEVSKTHAISTKGFKGSNSEHAYRDEEKRSYDPSSVGKIAISTSADANVGINKSLVVEPTIANARGYRDQVEDTETLKDVNIFSPTEMLTPGTARVEDPIRTAIATKQTQHIVPVTDASPSLVSNGYDEAIQFALSDDFVINAEEDGKVIDVNEEKGFIVVEYKSGNRKAISINPEIVRNSAGSFYMANALKPVHTKVGERFKKDEVLAYHDKYFTYSKMNGLRYAIGPNVKMAFMSTYNTYEDAGICTESLAERMGMDIVYQIEGKFRRNNNILSMVNVGDHVNIGDSLIKFDTSTEDNELSKYLSKLSDENAELLEEETKNDIKADHAGKVIDIKVYSILDPSNLSPSLANIVQKYFDKGLDKKKYLEQFDNTEGIIKAGYMLTDETEPVKNRYNAIKGNKGVDVLIEIYIEHRDIMGVGDKIALYSANKQIVSQVIPKGYEPYSEFRPDEEISVLTSPGTIARRMTPGVIPVSAAMKVLIELKRKIANDIKYR